ncbi:MAG: hypothetical protein QW343_00240 [Candidatus Norongarragalinales archaeon]
MADPSTAKKPRVVRVISDETLEAWEAQRAEYLKEHPEATLRQPDEFVREALGLRADAKQEEGGEAGEGKQGHSEPVEKSAEKAKSEEKFAAEEEKKESEKAGEAREAESRVEVEKPTERKPKIKAITEPTAKDSSEKPRIVERMQEQASRDVWPAAPRAGTPITLEEAGKEARVEEARRLWLARQEEKRKTSFFWKIKAALGFR